MKMSCAQWRFSFSIAEVVLLNSWRLNQQMIYHMLRFVIKNDDFVKQLSNTDEKKELLSSSHVKTLMLWTCETVDSIWWNSRNIVNLCCSLLYELAKWLDKKSCPNYFIPECNLYGFNFDQVRYYGIVQRVCAVE